MLVPFFFKLREGGVPVSTTEFLSLLAALQARVAGPSAEDFYYLSRACLVKDERHFDRFDRAFAEQQPGLGVVDDEDVEDRAAHGDRGRRRTQLVVALAR